MQASAKTVLPPPVTAPPMPLHEFSRHASRASTCHLRRSRSGTLLPTRSQSTNQSLIVFALKLLRGIFDRHLLHPEQRVLHTSNAVRIKYRLRLVNAIL